MKKITRINAGDLMLGMKFSAPVFFDDGENMFLAENKSVKPYHLAAIERWHIKTLLTYGHIIAEKNPEIPDSENFEYAYGVLEELETV